jgi:hypothetical protein
VVDKVLDAVTVVYTMMFVIVVYLLWALGSLLLWPLAWLVASRETGRAVNVFWALIQAAIYVAGQLGEFADAVAINGYALLEDLGEEDRL